MTLSPQQQEVATLIARGLSSKDIAERLGVALNTVEVHRYRLMRKLGVRSVAAVVHHAIRAGWVKVGEVDG